MIIADRLQILRLVRIAFGGDQASFQVVRYHAVGAYDPVGSGYAIGDHIVRTDLVTCNILVHHHEGAFRDLRLH